MAVPVLHEDYVCVLCCLYREHLHGTVVPDASEVPRPLSTHADEVEEDAVEALHIVSYNLSMMETFVDRVSRSSLSVQEDVTTHLDERLQHRARECKVAAEPYD